MEIESGQLVSCEVPGKGEEIATRARMVEGRVLPTSALNVLHQPYRINVEITPDQ